MKGNGWRSYILTLFAALLVAASGWAWKSQIAHGERLRAVEVRQEEYKDVLREVRDELKDINRRLNRALNTP